MKEIQGVMSIQKMSAFRKMCGIEPSAEPSVRTLIRSLESGAAKSQDVGFEIVRIDASVFLRLTDPVLEKFRVKLEAWVAENKPKNKT